MTVLLDRAVKELKKRSDREQDAVASDILARIGEPLTGKTSSAFGRGKSVLRLADPSDDLVDILTDEDVALWYTDKLDVR